MFVFQVSFVCYALGIVIILIPILSSHKPNTQFQWFFMTCGLLFILGGTLGLLCSFGEFCVVNYMNDNVLVDTLAVDPGGNIYDIETHMIK